MAARSDSTTFLSRFSWEHCEIGLLCVVRRSLSLPRRADSFRQAKVGIPISKQKLSFNGRILANSGTLGGLNFEGGERIVVAVKDVKKR